MTQPSLASIEWTPLASIPRNGFGFRSTPSNLAGHIILWQGNRDDRYDDNNRSILKYDPIKNKWTKWWSQENPYRLPCLAIDEQKNKLYIHSGNTLSVYKYDKQLLLSKLKTCTVSHTRFLSIPFMIGNRFTTIGGKNYGKHRMFFPKENTFKTIGIDDHDGVATYRAVMIKNKILLFSGNSIYTININPSKDVPLRNETKYTKYENVLPKYFFWFACIKTRGNDVLLFDGDGINGRNNSDKIYIIRHLNGDIKKNMKIRESNFKSPVKCIRDAINMNDVSKDELLVEGWLRHIWNESEFVSLQTLPICLVNLIKERHSIEIIHVLDRHGNHWNINCDEIFK